MSDARAKFLELAEARLEGILDKVRVFSNLANPGYPWTTAEIEAYFGRIGSGLQEARERFRKNKQWVDPTDPETAADEPSERVQGPSPASKPGSTHEIEFLREDNASLTVVLELQKTVIEHLKARLGE